jgi:hypothetical protein
MRIRMPEFEKTDRGDRYIKAYNTEKELAKSLSNDELRARINELHAEHDSAEARLLAAGDELGSRRSTLRK